MTFKLRPRALARTLLVALAAAMLGLSGGMDVTQASISGDDFDSPADVMGIEAALAALPDCDRDELEKLDAEFERTRDEMNADYNTSTEAAWRQAAVAVIAMSEACFDAQSESSGDTAAGQTSIDQNSTAGDLAGPKLAPVMIDNGPVPEVGSEEGAQSGAAGAAAPDSFGSGGEAGLLWDFTGSNAGPSTKWGAGSPFPYGGTHFEKGPRIPGGTVTYSFMPSGLALEGVTSIALVEHPQFQACWIDEIHKAFKLWEAVADIQFVEVPDSNAASGTDPDASDIRIVMHPGTGVLAHACAPNLSCTGFGGVGGGGDAHFDSAVTWTCDHRVAGAFDIGIVAAHEFGHSIGLGHEPTNGQPVTVPALMNGFYNAATGNQQGQFFPANLDLPRLHQDDASGAQEIYSEREADLAVEKTASANPAIAGEDLIYTITVSNDGPEPAAGVTVVDDLPLGPNGTLVGAPELKNVLAGAFNAPVCTSSAGTGPNGENQLTCLLDDIAPGEEFEFQVQLGIPADFVANAVPATDSVVIENRVEVDGYNLDLDRSNNTYNERTIVTDSADLMVMKLADSNTVRAGEEFVYTIYVDNLGPSYARNVVVRDNILASGNFEFVGAPNWSNRAGSCSYIPVIPAGETGPEQHIECSLSEALETQDLDIAAPFAGRAEIRIRLKANEAQQINNKVSVFTREGGTPDPDMSNNQALAVVSILDTADLQLTAPCTPDAFAAGNNTSCTFTVTNLGPSTADATRIELTVPEQFEVLTVSGSSPNGAAGCNAGTVGDWGDPATCDFGSLALNEVGTMVIELHSLPDAVEDNILDRLDVQVDAVARSSTFDPNLGNNYGFEPIRLRSRADLRLNKFAVGTPIAGEVFHYEYNIANLGPSVSRDVTLRDFLPDEVELVDAFVDLEGAVGSIALACGIAQASNAYLCPLGDIRPTNGVPVIVFVNVRIPSGVPAGTVLTNNADVLLTDTPDPDTTNNSDDATVTVVSQAELAVVKTASDLNPAAGEQLLYTITVTNLGPSDAFNVVVTDQLPQGFNYVADSDNCTEFPIGSGTMTCRPAGSAPDWILPVGQSVSFDILVELDQSVVKDELRLNRACANADNANQACGEVTVRVDRVADLRIRKFGKPDDVVRAGETLTYTLFVDNLGPSFTTPVVVTDSMISDQPFYLIGIEPDITHQYNVSCRYESRDPFSDAILFQGVVPPGIVNPIGPLPGNLHVTCNNISGGMQVFGPSNDPANGPGRWLINIAIKSDVTSSINNLAAVSGTDPDPNLDNNVAVTTHDVLDVSDMFVDKASFGIVTSPGCPPVNEEMEDMVTAGNTIRWTVAVGNLGPSPAENAKIVDRLPPWITVTDYEVIDGDGNIVGNCQTGAPGSALDRLTCGFGDLVPASATATRWINIEAVVDPSAPEGAILENDVMVMSDWLDDDNSNDFDSSLTQVKTAADLAVTKTHKPEPVVAGEALRYTVTVVNNGPSDARNVVVADQLPPEVIFVSAQTAPKSAFAASCGYNPLMHMVTCNFGTLPAGGMALFDIDVIVKPDAVPSGEMMTTIENVAKADVSTMVLTEDPCLEDNIKADVANVIRESDVFVMKADDPDAVLAGEELTYTIMFGNNGPSTATNVSVIDTLPDGVTFLRCEPADPQSLVTCSNPIVPGDEVEVTSILQKGIEVWNNTQGGAMNVLNDLDPGETYNFDIVVLVSPGYVLDGLGDLGADECGPLAEAASYPHFAHNVVEITALKSSFEISECTRVNAAADLEITKTDIVDLGLGDENAFLACDQVAPGGMITYTLTVTNLGPSDAAEVVVTDWLPAEYVAVDPLQVMVDVVGGEGFVEEIRDDGRITIVVARDPARDGDNAGNAELGRLNAGEDVVITIVAMVRRDARCGATVVNRARVETRAANDPGDFWEPIPGFPASRTPTLDPDASNNAVEETTTIECPSVVVVKTVSYDGTCPGATFPTQLPTGQPVTFCYEVTNTGTTYLDEIVIEDVLDTRTTMPTVIFTDVITYTVDPKVPVAPGEKAYRQVTIPSLYKECGTATNTVTVTANPVNSGRTDLPCLPLVSDSDTRIINIPCAGVDWRLGLPILESNEGTECEAWLQVQNVGDRDTKAVLVVWGDPGFCPPQAAGPLKVECTGLLRPGAAWSFAAGQMPQGARSAIAYAVNATDVVEDFDGNDRLFADVVCAALFDYVVGDHDRWATFDRAYRLGTDWRGPRDFSGFQLVLDFGAHQGEPLTVSVNRSCPDAGDPNAKSNAAYTGISRDQMGLRDPYTGSYNFYTPLLFANNAGLNSWIYLQNMGDECTSLEIWLKGQDNCLRPIIGDILTLSPGESVHFDPNTVVGPDWLGSAWIRATQPLAIVVDSMGVNHFTAYSGFATDVDDAGYTFGNQVNFAPLIYSEYQGWDTAIQVMNLSPVTNAKVKVYFLDRSGDVITTLVDWICPRGSQTFFLPTIAALGGNWVGSARVESQDWWAPGTNPIDHPRIASVVLLEKWSDPARTTRREAVAYNAQTECLLYDWQVGSGKGGTQSGSAVFAVPLLSKGSRGINSELAITNLVAKPGFTDFAIFIYDQNGLLDFVCEKLHDRQTEYIDLATWGYVPPNFLGSAVVSATFWEHDVFDPSGGFQRNLVGLGGVVVERVGARQGEPDIPGDESKAFEAAPIFDHFRIEDRGRGAPPVCPGQPSFGP